MGLRPFGASVCLEENQNAMEKVKPRTLSGFMELLPAPQVQMERIMQVLRETYALYGFYPLDTPLIESSGGAAGQGEAAKPRSRSTASPRATATCPYAST